MERLRRLNFPCFSFRVQCDAEVQRIWDPVRRRWLVLTPEEWVRAHVVRYLVDCTGVPEALIRVEYPVLLNGQPQRADVVVCTSSGQPRLVVECKAPTVTITQSVLDQAVRYNSLLDASYVWITNGLRHYCYRKATDGRYISQASLPGITEMRDLTGELK